MLPKTIYVKEEKDGKHTYMLVEKRPDDLAETTPEVIGEYKLVRKLKVQMTAEVTPVD